MRSHSKLLIQESPLQVLPTLACMVGLDKALVLQQIHYLIDNKNMGKIYEERRWFKNSARKWKENSFPFWSERKISRLLQQLEQDDNLLLSTTDLNTIKYDQEKWYTLDYDRLRSLELEYEDTLEYESAEEIIDENDGLPIDTDNIPICHQDQLDQTSMTTLYTKSLSKNHSKSIGHVLPNTHGQALLPLMNESDDMEKQSSNENQTIPTIDSKHPAIQSWRKANNRYPKKKLYPYIANRLGENPDDDVLKHVCTKWDALGFNVMNLEGKLEWYDDAYDYVKHGNSLKDWRIPERKTRESDKSMPASLGALEI